MKKLTQEVLIEFVAESFTNEILEDENIDKIINFVEGFKGEDNE